MNITKDNDIEEFISIKNKNQNKEWSVEFEDVTFVNKPPYRTILKNGLIYARYNFTNPLETRIALTFCVLNRLFDGNQRKFAKVLGVHYNTINNYVRTFDTLGYQGLIKGVYKQDMLSNSKTKLKEILKDANEQLNTDEHDISEEFDEQIISNLEQDEKHIETVLDATQRIETVETDSKLGAKLLFVPYINDVISPLEGELDEIDRKENKKNFWN